ncbi:unnamed protein product [Bemisia tabaci]|uniref:Uncharacterized protein n=1 Tax=Bemisia tabaci TaxID=7038 RepID=A0A9P0A0S3_BEMTA|nr:unnamed protein product [Bemisia tabaci]
MAEDKLPKKVPDWALPGRRRRGRPAKSWIGDIVDEIPRCHLPDDLWVHRQEYGGDGMPKKVLDWVPPGRRRRGRPMEGWREEIETEMLRCSMPQGLWFDRKQWRLGVEEREGVECKKAQPKEVMLPANLAKTRAASRGTYGESATITSGSSNQAQSGTFTPALHTASSIRYSPYPLPAANSSAVTSIIPNPTYIQIPYNVSAGAVHAQQCKRVFAAAVSAAAAAFRPPHPQPQSNFHHQPSLTYSMNDLLGLQSLDIPTLSTIHPHVSTAIGL